MPQVIGESGFRFLRALARAHGHGWAAFATDDDAYDAEDRTFGWIADRIHKRMLAAEAELFAGADLGLRPTLEHRTASGRLRWRVSLGCWEISAWRAGQACGGLAGDVCVASVEKSGDALQVRVGSALSAGAAMALARALSEATALVEIENYGDERAEKLAQDITEVLSSTPATDEEYAAQSRVLLALFAAYAVSETASTDCQSA